jgi:hypothetical protein
MEECVMDSSPKTCLGAFLAEFYRSEREELRKLGLLIERDRFGETCLDDQIAQQVESGNYGRLAQECWESFKESTDRLSPSA